MEGSIRTGERRAGGLPAVCVVLVGEDGLLFASLKTSRPGAEGGGSKGIVLSVLVLVTRRKSGPVGLWFVGDILVGDGGGSEALDAMHGWMNRGMVTDIFRGCGMTDVGQGLRPWMTGPGAKISPWDRERACPIVVLRSRCDRCALCRRRPWDLLCLGGQAPMEDGRDQ